MQTDDRVVANWQEFLDYIGPFVPKRGNPYGSMGFRGQEKATPTWRLQPSLSRQLPRKCDFNKVLEIERRLLDEFRLDAHRHLSTWEIPTLQQVYPSMRWLMAMQQYGAPTRLLDWTLSPYVAAYFAVRDAHDEDGVLWIHNYPRLVEALRKSKIEVSLDRIEKAIEGKPPTLSEPPGICAVYLNLQRPERMYAQQGFYMVCEDPQRAHDEVMNELAKVSGVAPFLHKIIIKCGAKEQFLANLRMMNITGASLFPGPDGLGRHVAEWGRLLAGGLAETPVQGGPKDSTGAPGQ